MANAYILNQAPTQNELSTKEKEKKKGFPSGSDDKESACNERDLGSIPGLGRSPGGEDGNPLQYSCLENPHVQRDLASSSPWGHKESDMTDRLSMQTKRRKTLLWQVGKYMLNYSPMGKKNVQADILLLMSVI